MTLPDGLETFAARGQHNLPLHEREIFCPLFFLRFESVLPFYLGGLLLLKQRAFGWIGLRLTLVYLAEGDFSWDCESDLGPRVLGAAIEI